MGSHTLLLNCCNLGNKNQFLRYSTKQTHIYTLFNDRLAHDEHLYQSLLRRLIASGTKLFFNLFFICILETSIVSKTEEGQTQRVIGNCMCFSDHRAFNQLRDRLCGRPMILDAVLQMWRSIFLFETDKNMLLRICKNASKIILLRTIMYLHVFVQ